MLQYMKAFLAEEERRKQQGLPSQAPASSTDDHAIAVTTEEESSDEEQPAKKIGRFAAINTADKARRSPVYIAPHSTSPHRLV